MNTSSHTPLDGKLVIVAVATGNVDEGISRHLLSRGVRVAALSRTSDKLNALRDSLEPTSREHFIAGVGDTGSLDGLKTLAKGIARDHGPIHHGVAGLGQWWKGHPAWEVSEDEFERFFAQSSRLHFTAARAIVPALADGGSYTMLAGLSAIKPIPNLSLVGMQAAAQVMLGQEMQVDAGERVRIYNLILGFIISRGRPSGQPGWLRAEDVGRVVERLAASSVPGRIVRADDRPTAEHSLAEAGA